MVSASPDNSTSRSPIDLGGKLSSQEFREFVPGARVVKAFNQFDVQLLALPKVAGGHRVQFYSGDYSAAKAKPRKIFEPAD